MKTINYVPELVKKGNINSLSDVVVAALTAMGGATGAYLNVIINWASLEDKKFVEEYFQKAKGIHKSAIEKGTEITNKIVKQLEDDLNI